jgi:hypothetical protein
MMLNILNFAIDRLRVQTQQFEKFSEKSVSCFDVLGYLPSGGRQRESAVPLVIDKASPSQAPDHIRHCGRAQLQDRCEVGDSGVAFLLD